MQLSGCTIVGTFGPDVLVGTSGDDVICGRGGDDLIRGGGGNDVLLGGTGDDVLYGGPGDDLIQGGRGDDRIFGDAGDDVLRGGRGADRLQAADGRSNLDRLNCGPGRDRVVADAPDRIRGGCEVVRQDHAPTSITLRPAVIAEAQPAGTVVGRLTAADRDRGDRHSFALVAGAGSMDNAAFRVQGTSLVSARTFKHESEPALRVRVRATDTTGLRLERILTVTVSDHDAPPTAVDDEQTVREDAAAAPVDVLANDTDADGGPRAIVSVTQPDHGTVQIAADGARVTYQPEPDHCTDDSNADTFTYRLAPGGSIATVRVTVRCEPDAPTLTTSDGVVSYTENAPAEAVDPGLTVRDADGRLAAADIELVAGFRAGEDVLELLGTHAGIAATWDSGRLRLVGDASVADYQAALRDVAYRNTSEAPTTSTRQVRVTVTDEASLSATDEKSMAVISVNDAPSNQVPGVQQVDEDAAATAIDGVSVADADAGSGVVETVLTTTDGTLTVATGTGNGSAEVTVRGTVDEVNDSLADLRYRPEADGSGDRSITITTSDLGNTGTGGALVDTDTIGIDVTAVNDAPVITAPGSSSVDENDSRRFSAAGDDAITVTDVDAGTGTVRAVLDATSGRLTLAGTTGLTFTVGDGTADAELDFTGTVDDITAALDGLSYQPDDGFHGSDRIAVSVDDRGNTGAGGAKSASATIDVTVNRVNAPPVNTVPAAQTTDEDTTLSFTGGTRIAVADPDVDPATGTLEVDLTVGHGRVTLDGVAGLTFTTGDGTGDTELVVSGSPDALNAALDGATYRPDADYAGADTLTITTDDLGAAGLPGALSDTDTVRLTITAVNDAPEVTVPALATVEEDTTQDVTGVSVADVDAGTDDLEVRLSVDYGALALGERTGLTFSTGDGTDDQVMVARGTLGALNAALASLSYRGSADRTGADALDLRVDDLGHTGSGGAKTADDVAPIVVTAVNDAPVNTVPGAQTTAEDTTLTLSGSNALTVADVDAATLQVTLSAVNGTLTLAGTTGLTVTDGTGTNDPAMTFTGTKAAINTALDGLQLRPAADHHGSAELRIVTSDSGATGSGGIQTDTDDVAITVTPVNDAPSFTQGPNQSGIANTGTDGQATPYTIDPWATAISAGPGESDQTVTFDVSTDDEDLFTTVPSVSPAGALRFTPNPEATGTATVTVRLVDDGGTDDGGTDTSVPQTFTIEIVEPGPSIASISPSPLVPGAPATLTGREFSLTAANNTVTIGGTAATVTAATATSLTVTVPCVSSGAAVAVAAKVGAIATNTLQHPLQAVERDLDVGESLVLDDTAQIGCNELAATGGNARYLVAAFSASTSPSSNSPFTLSGAVAADPVTPDTANAPAVPTPPAGTGSPVSPDLDSGAHDNAHEDDHGLEPLDGPDHDDRHTELLENNRVQYEVLREEFGTDGIQRRGAQPDTAASDLPMSRPFRISNINATGGATVCNSYYTANATRVYAEGKLVIYEDDATPDGLKAANNPAMAEYYDQIGDQFNSDMEPIIRDNFGDVLRRDAVTDNNGVMIALSTPRINNSFSGTAGFVVTCDQFPNDDTSTPPVGGPYAGTGVNGASNFGEFFYLYQPTNTDAGFAAGTASTWYRTIRSTFIHESKHVASQAARVANDAPSIEDAWLEEGTARLAEELWARQAVDNLPWKANTGYGSATDPINVYCDLRPGFSECDSNPRRPASIMQRHFTSLYTHLFGTNARLLSPFGATASDNASYYYAVSWSLVRYAIDRYGTSDAAFLTALTQSTSTGVANLSERTGVSTDQLLGRWATSLALDDHPLLTSSTDDTAFATWNFRSIYAGLNQDLPSTYTMAYPLAPTQFGFGTFTANSITTLRGGGVLWYELSGSHTKAQLLRMQGNSGAAVPTTLRLAITRVQ